MAGRLNSPTRKEKIESEINAIPNASNNGAEERIRGRELIRSVESHEVDIYTPHYGVESKRAVVRDVLGVTHIPVGRSGMLVPVEQCGQETINEFLSREYYDSLQRGRHGR